MNFLGVDIGSTNMKCRLLTDDNTLLFANENTYGSIYKASVEYIDMSAIYDAFEHMVQEASKYGEIHAISISSFGESFVLLDDNEDIVLYPMLYTDPRGEEETKDVLKIVDQSDIFRMTGTIPQSMYSLYKLLWFKKHHPDDFLNVKKFMQIADYINYKMTGKHVTDYSLAARSGVFNLEQKKFSTTLLQRLDIPTNIFPKAYKTGTNIGYISETFAKNAHISSACQVVIGGHDQVMAAIGSGVIRNNMAIDGMGTVECITTTFANKINDINLGRKGYAMVPFLDGYCTYMFNYTGGSLVQWAKKHVFQNLYTELEMEKHVKMTCDEQPSEVLTLPYFGGAATPHQNIHAKGSFLNLSTSTSSAELYKSILEGLSYEMKYNLETIKSFGVNVDHIIVSGGGSSSKLWLNIKATVFNKQIHPLQNKESGITGAIMLCSVALKGYDLDDAVKVFVKYLEPIKPIDELVKTYEKQYDKYKKIYPVVVDFTR